MYGKRGRSWARLMWLCTRDGAAATVRSYGSKCTYLYIYVLACCVFPYEELESAI